MNETIEKIEQLLADNNLNELESFLVDKIALAKNEQNYPEYLVLGKELLQLYRSQHYFEKSLQVNEDLLMLMDELEMEQSETACLLFTEAGITSTMLGKEDQASFFYRKCIDLFPLIEGEKSFSPYFVALVGMGSFYNVQKDYEKALYYYSTVYDLQKAHKEYSAMKEILESCLMLSKAMEDKEKTVFYTQELKRMFENDTMN